FLTHRLFRSLATGQMINRAWLAPRFPPYWQYDILHALLVLSRMGKAVDPRTGDALDELERRRRRPDGRWQPGGYWWKPPTSSITPEVVDWGRSGPNEMITLNALRVQRAASRLTRAMGQTRGRPRRSRAVTGTARSPRAAPTRARHSSAV